MPSRPLRLGQQPKQLDQSRLQTSVNRRAMFMSLRYGFARKNISGVIPRREKLYRYPRPENTLKG
jgi:hypothetical protein